MRKKKLKNVFLGLLCHTNLKNAGRLDKALIRSLKVAFFITGGAFLLSLMLQIYGAIQYLFLFLDNLYTLQILGLQQNHFNYITLPLYSFLQFCITF